MSLIKGPVSWYEHDGRASAECEDGVRLTFTSSDASSNLTSITSGQLPMFKFSFSFKRVAIQVSFFYILYRFLGVLLQPKRISYLPNNETSKQIRRSFFVSFKMESSIFKSGC